MPAVEPILLSITQVTTCLGERHLTNATGFFFRRGSQLYLVTNRHIVIDEANGHFPDRLLIKLFIDPDNLTRTTYFSIPLYQNRTPVWRQAQDSSGTVDVVAIALEPRALPETMVYEAFTEHTLCPPGEAVEVGTPLMLLGFPLGFSDSLHNLPVVRQAVLASSFGLRFEGMGYFLTDARTHRGISGAPVVMRVDRGPDERPDFHWHLLGIHSTRLDVGTRDRQLDEVLGLNCAWYADIVLTLTESQ